MNRTNLDFAVIFRLGFPSMQNLETSGIVFPDIFVDFLNIVGIWFKLSLVLENIYWISLK